MKRLLAVLVAVTKIAVAQTDISVEETKAQADLQRELASTMFGGTWKGMECYVGKLSASSLNRGCTGREMAGRNWGDHGVGQFQIASDGTVNLGGTWGCKGDVVAVFYGRGIGTDVRWEVRPKDGPPSEIWGWMDSHYTEITVSCNRPLSPRDPLQRRNDSPRSKEIPYMYISWTRVP